MSIEERPIVTCCDCHTVLDEIQETFMEERRPCPSCGSMKRLIVMPPFQAVTEPRLRLGLKGERPGQRFMKKKHFIEMIVEDNLYRATGVWNKLVRILNRENDRYYEHITDSEGNVIHHCEEPLSQHRDRGSAKHKDKEPERMS